MKKSRIALIAITLIAMITFGGCSAQSHVHTSPAYQPRVPCDGLNRCLGAGGGGSGIGHFWIQRQAERMRSENTINSTEGDLP